MSERLPPPPPVYRYPNRRIAQGPKYNGPFRRAEDRRLIASRIAENERTLGTLLVITWTVGAACLILGAVLVARLFG